MAKIKNDPDTYKKRSDFACHGSRQTDGKLTSAQKAGVLNALGAVRRGHIPFAHILKK